MLLQQAADFLESQTATNTAYNFALAAPSGGAAWTIATYVVVAHQAPTSNIIITLEETLPNGSAVVRWRDLIPAGAVTGRATLPNGIPLRFHANSLVEFKVTTGGSGIETMASLAAYKSEG